MYTYPSDEQIVQDYLSLGSIEKVEKMYGRKRGGIRNHMRRRPQLQSLIAEARQVYYSEENKQARDRQAKLNWKKVNKDWISADNHKRRAFVSERSPVEYITVLRNDLCSYCGVTAEDTPEGMLYIDHIEPLSRAGTNEGSNLTAACNSCNASKGTKDLLTFMLVTRSEEST